jgi:hypothetical protein
MPRDPKRGTVADYVRRDPGAIVPPPTTKAFRDGMARMGHESVPGDWCPSCDRRQHFCTCPKKKGRKTT